MVRRNGWAVVIAGCLFAASVKAQTWDGGGVAGGSLNWTTGTNWVGDFVPVNNGTANITMAGTIDVVNTVDVNFDINSLTFNNTAGPFAINNSGGTTLTIRGGGITNQDVQTQTINAPLILAAGQTWNALAGALTIGGTVNLGTFQLTVDGTPTTTINGVIQNTTGTLVKNGGGNLFLAGNNLFSGGLALNSGALTVANNGAAGTGTLTINGGTVIADIAPKTLSNTVALGNFSTSGADLTFSGAATLRGNHTITVNNATTFSGAVSEIVAGLGFTKAGTGTLTLSGGSANTYTGTTTVNSGTLVLSKTAGVNAVANALLTVGDGVGMGADILRLGASNQIPDSADITVNSTGLFDLFGSSETINGLTLVGSGDVSTGTGTLTLGGNLSSASGTTSQTISGNLNLAGGNRTFDVALGMGSPNLDISAAIANGGITKTNEGVLQFSGSVSNTYAGTTTVNAGLLTLAKTGGAQAIQGPLVIGDGILGDTVTFDVVQLGAANQISGDVTVNSSGVLSLGVFNEQVNSLTLAGGSVATTAGMGTLSSLSATITSLASSQTASISGGFDMLGGRTFSVAAGTTPSGIDLDISAVITNGTLTKSATGSLRLAAANSFAGGLNLNSGTLILADNTAAGTGTITMAGGTTIQVEPAIALTVGNAVSITSGTGTIDVGSTGSLALNGVISGSGSLLTKNGIGTLELGGSSNNTYTGTTTVTAGALTLAKSSGTNGAILGNLIIGDGSGSDTVDIVAPNQIANTANVTVNAGGQLNVGAAEDGFGTLTLNGGHVFIAGGSSLTLQNDVVASLVIGTPFINSVAADATLNLNGTRTFTVNDDGQPAFVDLSISAPIVGGTLVKAGDGLLLLSGSFDNTASAIVDAGIVVAQKSASAAALTGNVVVGDGIGGVDADVLMLNADHQIAQAPTDTLTVNSSGQFDLNNRTESIGNLVLNGGHVVSGTLSFTGDVTVNANAQTAEIGSDIFLDSGTTDFSVADGSAALDCDIGGDITDGTLNKTGDGTLRLGFNTIADNTVTINVNQGTMLLRGFFGPPIEGILNVGDGVGGQGTDIARLEANNQIADDAVALSVQSSGLLDLNGFSDTVGDFYMTAGTVTTGAGTLTLSQFVATFAHPLASSITGNVDLGNAPRSFNVHEGAAAIDLVVSGTVTAGPGGQLVKEGAGTLQLDTIAPMNFPVVLETGTLTGVPIIGPTGSLTQNSGNFAGSLTNQGAFTFNGGFFTGQLVNEGVVSLGAHFTAGNGVINFSTITFDVGESLTANGAGLDNQGSMTLAGGTVDGDGPLVNNGTLTGRGTIGGSAGFANNGSLILSGGNFSISNSAGNTNAGFITVSSALQLRLLGGNLTNTGLIDLDGGSVTGTAMLINAPGGTIQGGSSVQSLLTNDGGLIHANSGTTLLLTNFTGGNINGGELRIDNGSGINAVNAFNSSGTIVLLGANAQLIGGAIANTGTIRGSGRVTSSVQNSGTVLAENGRLTLSSSGHTNAAAGIIEANAAAEVFYSQGLATNNGQIALASGTFDNNNRPLDNNGSVAGDGVIRTGGLTNDGSIGVGGGDLDLFGPVTNNTTVTIQTGSTARFFGPVNGPGNYPGGGTTMFLNSFSPGASPSQVSFGGDLVFGGAASLTMELAGTTPGTQHDRLVVGGSASLAGSLNVVLLDSFAPSAGNAFEIINAAGGVVGTFSNELLPALGENLEWNVLYGSNTVTLQVLSTALPGDFNLDGFVDAADFVVWAKGGLGVDTTPENYNLWRTNFGRSLAGGGSGSADDAGQFGVPEPTSLLLLVAGAMLLAVAATSRRQRRGLSPFA